MMRDVGTELSCEEWRRKLASIESDVVAMRSELQRLGNVHRQLIADMETYAGSAGSERNGGNKFLQEQRFS